MQITAHTRTAGTDTSGGKLDALGNTAIGRETADSATVCLCCVCKSLC